MSMSTNNPGALLLTRAEGLALDRISGLFGDTMSRPTQRDADLARGAIERAGTRGPSEALTRDFPKGIK